MTKDKKQEYELIVKSLIGKNTQEIQRLTPISQLIAVAKGMIDPLDLRFTGALRSEEANAIINLMVEDDFLNKITTERMSKATKDFNILDLAPRQLKRIAQGSEPATGDLAEPTATGTTLTSLPVQLFATITLDTLRDNADNPGIIDMIQSMLQTVVTNDLTDLGINGTADTGGSFLALSKGWIQIATDNVTCPKVTVDPGTNTWVTSLAAIRAAASQLYKGNCVFIASASNADAYDIELAKHVTGAALITSGTGQTFLRQPIVTCRYMPDTKIIYTPIKNLVMGMSTVMHRDAAYHPRKRCLEITYDMAVDYEIAIKSACVLATVT